MKRRGRRCPRRSLQDLDERGKLNSTPTFFLFTPCPFTHSTLRTALLASSLVMATSSFDPFSLNLKQQTSTLLARLHILSPPSAVDVEPSTLPPLPTTSPYNFLPLSHLSPLYQLAYGPCAGSSPSASTPEEVLDLLSDLLEVGPLTLVVAELFRPLLMVLMARWVDRVRGGKEEWVRRVVAGTLLAEGVEEVWP